ncbi:hypothetical protein ID866_11645 [Astraeus odoratus]|nr:hypothetical protein ID866_11645 [Astraeus odoratus]
MLKGATRFAPPSAKQDLQKPVTAEIIANIKQHLTNKPLDITVYTCLTSIFYTAARVGEFTTCQCNHFDPAENITPAGVRTETDCNSFQMTVFTLPCTKVSATGEEVQWVRQNRPTDPQTALTTHMATNNPLLDGPLFAYKDGSKHRPLSKATFLRQLKALARAARHEAVQGHGIRVGATLEYLLCGVPFDMMKIKGQWASDAFQLYLWKHNQILAPYIRAMLPGMATEFTRLAMPPVC